jgi:catechol 2,3-dioxygenase-like lactoylglutathione lyase family enzyme
MSRVDFDSEAVAGTPPVKPGEARLEVVVVPISDVDRAKRFYEGPGWRLDADLSVEDGYRVVQLRPPGSAYGWLLQEIKTRLPGR